MNTLDIPLPETLQHRIRFCDLTLSRTRLYGAVIGAGVIYISSGLIESDLFLNIAIILVVLSAPILSLAYFLHQNLKILIEKLIDSGAVGPNDLFDRSIYPAYKFAFPLQFLSLHIMTFIAGLIIVDRLILIRNCELCNETTHFIFMVIGIVIALVTKEIFGFFNRKKSSQAFYTHNQPVISCTFEALAVDDEDKDHKHVYLTAPNGVRVDANEYARALRDAKRDAEESGVNLGKSIATSPKVLDAYRRLQTRLAEALAARIKSQ